MTPSSNRLINIPSQSQLDDSQMFNPYLSPSIPYVVQPAYQQAAQDNNGYSVYPQPVQYNPSLVPYWSGGTPVVYSPTSIVSPTPIAQVDYVKPHRRRESISRSNNLYMPYAYARPELANGSTQPVPTSIGQATLSFPPTLHSTSEAAEELRQFCADAERRRETAEPGAALISQLLQRLPKAGAPRGTGSRQGCEAYRCLWPDCGQEIRRKPNAIAHLLTHAGYKPFVCQECPHHPRFRYKHDYTRHCRNHIPMF